MRLLAIIWTSLLWSGLAQGRGSTLPILYSCDEPSFYVCRESYFNFEPSTNPMCGLGNATRNVECRRDGRFLGACRSSIQGGGGYSVQMVTYYYGGGVHGSDPAQTEAQCKMMHGEYLGR